MAGVIRWPLSIVSLFLVLAVSIVGTAPLIVLTHAADLVRLNVSTRMSEHEDLQVQVLVTRDPANRFVTVTAESTDYYSSSAQELEGERAPNVKVVWFRSLPAGVYEITGAVYDARGNVRGSSRVSTLVFPQR